MDIRILKAVFRYNPRTGRLYRGRELVKGTPKYPGGPLLVYFERRNVSYARVCFAIHHGYLPAKVRHFGKSADNRAENLYDPAKLPEKSDRQAHEGIYRGVSVIRDQRTARHRGYQGSVYFGNPTRRHRTAVVETPEEARDLRAALKEWLEWVESQKGTAQ